VTAIGFVGLGQMGGAMSRNLLAAGHSLRVFDLNKDAVAALAAEGAIAADSGRAAAEGAETLFTMLPKGQHVEAALFGPDGIAEGLAPGSLVIDMSTIQPSETRAFGARLAAQGCAMVDAPVGRTSAHAVKGTSTFMMGGAPEDIERALPLLRCLGEAFTHCGPLGSGTAMKLVNNYISTVTNVATAEGVALGLAAGLKLEDIVAVTSQTPAGLGHITTTWPEKALKDEPAPAFMLDLAAKDLGLALETAAMLKVPMASGAGARQIYSIAQAQDRGRDDWTTGILRSLRGLKR